MAMRTRSPPCCFCSCDEAGFAFEGHGVGDEHAAGCKARPGGQEDRPVGDAATDEDGVGGGRIGKARRRRSGRRCQDRGAPSASALAAIMASRAGSRSKARARALRAARIHSMATEPQPAPTSQSRRGRRSERGERRGAHLALGQLAVMAEGLIGQAGNARQDDGTGAGAAGDGERVEVGEVRLGGGVGGGEARACCSAGPPMCSSTVSRLCP